MVRPDGAGHPLSDPHLDPGAPEQRLMSGGVELRVPLLQS